MVGRRWVIVALVTVCSLAACSPALDDSGADQGGGDSASVPLVPQVRTFNHSPMDAADIAEEHLRLALVEQDSAGAYELLAPETQARLSVAQLQQALPQLAGFGSVASLEATHYQPVPGTDYVDIFLVGTGGSTSFHYAARLKGSAESGYLVSEIWQTEGLPEDSTMLRELP